MYRRLGEKRDLPYYDGGSRLMDNEVGRCPFCMNVKMRVLTVQVNGKRERVGEYCPYCHDMYNWIKNGEKVTN